MSLVDEASAEGAETELDHGAVELGREGGREGAKGENEGKLEI